MQSAHINSPSTEHAEWLSELSFHKDELAIFKKQLTDVAGKNTAIEIMNMSTQSQKGYNKKPTR